MMFDTIMNYSIESIFLESAEIILSLCAHEMTNELSTLLNSRFGFNISREEISWARTGNALT